MTTDRIRFAEIELKVEKAKAAKLNSAILADIQWLLDELRPRLIAEDQARCRSGDSDDDH